MAVNCHKEWEDHEAITSHEVSWDCGRVRWRFGLLRVIKNRCFIQDPSSVHKKSRKGKSNKSEVLVQGKQWLYTMLIYIYAYVCVYIEGSNTINDSEKNLLPFSALVPSFPKGSRFSRTKLRYKHQSSVPRRQRATRRHSLSTPPPPRKKSNLLQYAIIIFLLKFSLHTSVWMRWIWW